MDGIGQRGQQPPPSQKPQRYTMLITSNKSQESALSWLFIALIREKLRARNHFRWCWMCPFWVFFPKLAQWQQQPFHVIRQVEESHIEDDRQSEEEHVLIEMTERTANAELPLVFIFGSAWDSTWQCNMVQYTSKQKLCGTNTMLSYARLLASRKPRLNQLQTKEISNITRRRIRWKAI